MSDRIVISGLIVHAVIGVYAFEQSITQPLSIDLSFSINAEHVAANDALSDTVDYAAVCASIDTFVKNTPCRLLETLSYRLADHLEKQFHLSALELSITKKPKDMPNVVGVRVDIKWPSEE